MAAALPSSSSSAAMAASLPTAPPASSSSSASMQQSDDDRTCRVCHDDDSDEALYMPCACNGSIAYVHQSCLTSWLSIKGVTKCELCHTEITFENLYATDAPKSPTLNDFFYGIYLTVIHAIPLAARTVMAIAAWLLFLPLVTAYTMRLFYELARTFTVNALVYRLTHYTPHQCVVDIQVGIYTCIVIFIASLTIFSLRELLRDMLMAERDLAVAVQMQEQEQQRRQQQQQPQPAAAEVNDAAENNLYQAAQAAAVPLPADDDHELVMPVPIAHIPTPVHQDQPGAQQVIAEQHATAATEQANIVVPEQAAQPEAVAAVDQQPDQPAAAPDADINNAAAIPADNAPAAAVPAANAEQQRNRWAELELNIGEMDDVSLLQWIGLVGNLRFFFIHLWSVVVFNILFLAIGFLLPYTIGQLIFTYTGHSAIDISWRALQHLLSMVDNKTLNVLEHVNTVRDSVSSVTMNNSSSDIGDLLFNAVSNATTTVPTAAASALPSQHLLTTLHARFRLHDVLVLSVGYVIVLVGGLLWSRSMPLANIIRTLIVQTLLAIKVIVLLTIELITFPGLVGIAITFTTLEATQSTMEVRRRAMARSPIASLLLCWFVGILFMLCASFYVNLLRKTLKRSVLIRYIRYTDEHNFEPFRDLVQQPVTTHSRRLFKSAILYAVLVIMCLHIPCKLVAKSMPQILPLRLSFGPSTNVHSAAAAATPASDTLHVSDVAVLDVPLDLLLFHFILPLFLDRINSKLLAQQATQLWFKFATRLLGLEEYLMPNTNPPPPAAAAQPVVDVAVDANVNENDGHPVVVIAPHVAANRYADQSPDSSQISHFPLRILALVIMVWVTHILMVGVGLVLPLLIGRYLLRELRRAMVISVHGTSTHSLPSNSALAFTYHDLYSLLAGIYMEALCIYVVSKSIEYVRNKKLRQGLVFAYHWSIILCKWLFLSVFIFIVLPTLTEILLSGVVGLPLLLPPHQSTAITNNNYTNVSNGLLFLKAVYTLVLAGVFGENHWQRDLRRVGQDGIRNVRVMFIMKQLIIPLISQLLLHICLPYVIVRGILPLRYRLPSAIGEPIHAFTELMLQLYYSSDSRTLPELQVSDNTPVATLTHLLGNHLLANGKDIAHYAPPDHISQLFDNLCFRWAWASFIALRIMWHLLSYMVASCRQLQQRSYEQRYVVGKRLINRREVTQKLTPHLAAPAAINTPLPASPQQRVADTPAVDAQSNNTTDIIPALDATQQTNHERQAVPAH